MKTRRSSIGSVALCLAIAAPAGHAQMRLPSAAPDGPGFGVPTSPSWAVPPAVPPAAPAAPRPVDRVVAVVNAEAITEGELALRTRSVMRRIQLQGAGSPPPDELRRQVLERMILERAQVQTARDAGVRIDDATVDRTIARIAGDAKLSVAQLRERLAAEGTSFATFRQEVTTELTISRLREREVDARIQVSEAEIDAYLAEQAARPEGPAEYNIAQIVVRVPEDASADQVEQARERAEAIASEARGGVPFEQIAARLAGTPEGISGAISGGVLGMRPADRLPPLFVEAVAPLAAGQIAPVVRSPAGFHVLRLTDRSSGGPLKLAGVPVRQTRARHILVRVNELNPEAEVVRRLTEIRERIEGGTADFAEMARQYSADGSASQGGDLGWIYPGDTVPEFERAMDGLAPSQIAGPVRSPFGYHLIQVVERRTDAASPDRLRAAARNALRERKVAEALQDWTAQIRDRAYVEYRLEDR